MSGLACNWSFKIKVPTVVAVSQLYHVHKICSQDDYQFMQHSKVPTMHFQASLPRLPIPELEKTCERYLQAQMPLLNNEQLSHTKKAVAAFRNNDGPFLQKELKEWDKRNNHTNYISEPWFDMYLKDRAPLPINYNPLIVFMNETKPGYGSQLIRATNMLISSLRFMRSLRANLLEPEVYHLEPKKSDTKLFRTVTRLLPSPISWYGAYLFKAYPLDMSQYPSLFNSTRIPEIGKDRLFRDESAKHVLIMRNGNFYAADVLDKNGNILEPADILACLKYILEDTSPSAEYPVGVLTTENRDTWAKVRKDLEDKGNGDALRKIDSSIFNLVLDDTEINDDLSFMLHHFLHGDGTNRFFDKSFSLLISKDGYAAINFEHSWGDGVAVLRYFQDMLKDSTEKPYIHPDTQPSNCQPEKLVQKVDFKLDDKAKEHIMSAKKKYDTFCKSLSINYFESNLFGKKACKEFRVAPDSIMQLAFQLAFHNQNGRQVATYESCSTAAFKHGRTETVRPCTMETKSFCEAVNARQKPSIPELAAMIRKCSEVHSMLTRNAAMGQGFDRHLFGLKRIAEQSGKKLPALYQDPAYAAINYNILSTSTLSSPAVRAGGFGPVVKDGFGIGYGIQNETLGAVVSSYPPARDGSDFVDCLQRAFEEIYSILKSSNS